jgi:glycerophosphoryl diester phosphodiesterase
MMKRREFVLGGIALTAVSQTTPLRLIAHRGGIVDDTHAENSQGSIEAAIARGYWMLEVDVRATKDGEPVLQHDPTMERFYGVKQRPEDLTWKELRALKAQPGGTSPIHFDELCQMVRGKARLMLDIKNSTMPSAFYQGMARSMSTAGLIEESYMLGGDKWRSVFGVLGTKESANRKALAAASERGEDVKRRYFLFELASELDGDAVALCRKLGVDCVAAVNEFRYVMAKRDVIEGPREDVARLMKLGVRSYQIDSKYESTITAAA